MGWCTACGSIFGISREDLRLRALILGRELAAVKCYQRTEDGDGMLTVSHPRYEVSMLPLWGQRYPRVDMPTAEYMSQLQFTFPDRNKDSKVLSDTSVCFVECL